ncbi:hypothetical protein, partial [Roseovarius sp.]|uniref:hypothetical protein n=1 Tax=Roseovarius sp. TaxID=1486281 RepID=UPI003A97C7EA
LLFDHPNDLRLGKTALSHVSAPSELTQTLHHGEGFRGGQVNGRLADEVSGWDYVHNRRGRERRLGGDHSSVIIQAVEWDYVLSTSRQANRALLDAAGLDRARTTDFTKQRSIQDDSQEGTKAAE